MAEEKMYKARSNGKKQEAKKQTRSKLGGEGEQANTAAGELSPKHLRPFPTHKKNTSLKKYLKSNICN